MYWLEDLLTYFNASPTLRRAVPQVVSLLAIMLPVPVILAFMRWSRPRQGVIPPYRERVLILGGTSGTGRELALAYARRGCRHLAIVGRRGAELQATANECRAEKVKGEAWEMSDEAPGHEKIRDEHGGVLAIQGDCASVDDIVRIREQCRAAFDGGLDTLHICFGVSALRPLLGIAGIDPVRPMERADLIDNLPKAKPNSVEADQAGLRVTQHAARRVNEVNVVGTSVILSAFLPMLQTTSASPSIHLLSSASAYIPAPTRSLYGSSKAGQLILFQSVGVEAAAHARHSARTKSKPARAHVRFYASVPGTIRSDFRASAVDGSPDTIQASDSSWDAAKKGAKTDVLAPFDLAQHIILAVDQYKEGTDELPSKYWYARRAFPFVPSLMAKMATKKYAYH